ncbi:MAG: ATP synthase subunit I [Burkholderiales bacterium]|nr:ATP synthase subunit I [Burkholderiales bacterium]
MSKSASGPRGGAQDEATESDFTPLSAQEAQALRERNPSVSPWWVVMAQVVVGAVAALLAWLLTGSPSVAWSLAYGALAVALPAALFARGLSGRLASVNPMTAALGFLVWQMVKLALTMAMLFAAPRLVVALSWPALLVGLVLALKVYWVALRFAPRNMKL